MSIPHLLWIALGGALGAVSRALVGHWMQTGFPWATLVVNVAGSFVIGLVLGAMGGPAHLPQSVRLLVATGFCGAFTTFSSFSYQTLTLLNEDRWLAASANIGLNLALCLLATWLGIKLALAWASA